MWSHKFHVENFGAYGWTYPISVRFVKIEKWKVCKHFNHLEFYVYVWSKLIKVYYASTKCVMPKAFLFYF
jgi:hypothetical protein